jgi:hypothetical protein
VTSYRFLQHIVQEGFGVKTNEGFLLCEVWGCFVTWTGGVSFNRRAFAGALFSKLWDPRGGGAGAGGGWIGRCSGAEREGESQIARLAR